MSFDFPALLVGATLFTGLAWALDAAFLAPRRRQKAASLVQDGVAQDSDKVAITLKEPTWIEYCKSFFPHPGRTAVAFLPGGTVSYPIGFHDADPAGG